MEKKDAKLELEEKEKEALFIIKQDLCRWLNKLLDVSIESDTFLAQLDTGVLLCQLASLVQQRAAKHEERSDKAKQQRNIPLREIQYNKKARHESFHARDNTANFITWCRDASIEEAVMFESNGLVLHNDERRVILCLLEVARIAGQLGMITPELIELEREIDSLETENDTQELERGHASTATSTGGGEIGNSKRDGKPPNEKKRKKDSLDNKVLMMFNQCTCANRLQVIAHGCGKFEVTLPSSRKMIIYVRVLSDRILVRVGGGWDSIEHFILKHDPCRQGISVVSSSVDKEVKVLAPDMKIVSNPSKAPRPQRKAKQMSPYATPKHRNIPSSSSPTTTGITKSTSTPLLLQLHQPAGHPSPSKKRKLK